MVRAFAFALTLIVPSTMIVHRYFGGWGVAAYCAIALIALLSIHRRFFNTLVPALSRNSTVVLAAGFAACLVLAFAVGYPLANSGVVGPGSDRDEHINIATMELLHGRFPYYQTGAEGNPITHMPGALLLAAPFVLLGNGAYQNLFWLVVFAATVAAVWRDIRPALLLVMLLMAFSPVVLREYVNGGDLFTNAIYVMASTVWLVGVAPRPRHRWSRVAAAIAFGISLSSRVHFLLVAPLVFSALWRRSGSSAAVQATAIAGAAFALVTLPFYLYDPGGFWPFLIIEYVEPEEHGRLVDAALLAMPVAASLGCALDRAIGDLRVLLKYCTLVLAVAILTDVFPAAMLHQGQPAYNDLLYGLSWIPFGAVAFMPATFPPAPLPPR